MVTNKVTKAPSPPQPKDSVTALLREAGKDRREEGRRLMARRDPEMTDQPTVYTVPETAELLRISDDVVYAAVKRGDIRAVRLGRTIRIPRAEIDRLCQPSTGSPDGDEPQGLPKLPGGKLMVH